MAATDTAFGFCDFVLDADFDGEAREEIEGNRAFVTPKRVERAALTGAACEAILDRSARRPDVVDDLVLADRRPSGAREA